MLQNFKTPPGYVRTDVWQQFLATPHTLGSPQREYPGWHQGRSRFCLWGLMPNHAALTARVWQLREQLADYLLLPYRRQPHITLSACGFWCSAMGQPDDYTKAQFKAHRMALQELRRVPITLTVSGLNSFSSALYLEVQDPEGRLEQIRSLLPGYLETIREQTFVPHITIGVYRDHFDCRQVARQLAQIELTPQTLTLDQLHLLSYSALDIGSPLQVEFTHPLR